MQLGIRLHDTAELPFEERIALVHDMGYKCGHLALSKIKGLPSAPYALTPGYAMYLRRVFEKNNVDVAVLGCYLNLAEPVPEKLESIRNKYIAAIRFASMLGAGMVGTETGAPNSEYKYDPECRTEWALQSFIKELRGIVKYAEEFGVMFAIEPVAKHIVWNADRAKQVLDEVDSPNLGIIFDPVNLLDGTNYKNREEIFEHTIDLLGERIIMIHLKDFTVNYDGTLNSVGCGIGEMNYERILRFVKEKKPFIHATLENTTPENHAGCRDHILKIYDSI
ncbi:MAG: sugar phosphate isomerase/epimerase [Lachnospiraceae bacterium]|nr:sugar phosphate isomerase/epimerase [Lachnospiraceae bacterium]